MLRDPPDERDPAALLSFGVLNLDKPAGPSAHQVSAWVRDMVGDALEAAERPRIDRAAHAGTLDPKVTGCLPVLTGDATRLSMALADAPKEYVAVLELHAEPPADLEAVLAEFEAPIYQKPPRKSAVARRLRVREIYDLDLLEVAGRKALLRIRCESGTYVRKLCHDVGLALGTGAHMGDLRRAATGSFDDASLVTLQDLSDALARWRADGEARRASENASGKRPRVGENDWLREVVQPGERALRDLPSVTIAPSAAREVAEGAPVYAPGVIEVDEGVERGTLVACYTPDGSAVCLGRLVGDADAERGMVVDLERVLV